MAKTPQPFTLIRRRDSKTYRLTLNSCCGIPPQVCKEWYRRSFSRLPAELAAFRNPKISKNDSEAKTAAYALIQYLKKEIEENGGGRITAIDITVGAWLEKFTRIETSPRTGINASKNRPYSIATLKNYRGYFTCHIQGDPITDIKMAEIEEEDILEFMTRLSLKKKVYGGKKKKKN